MGSSLLPGPRGPMSPIFCWRVQIVKPRPNSHRLHRSLACPPQRFHCCWRFRSKMALRRGIGSLSSLVNSLQRLALSEGLPVGASCSLPSHAAPTLVSLRSLWLPATSGPSSSVAAAAGAAEGCGRRFSAAAAAQQQAAAAAAGEESLEQIRSRIFGSYIGECDPTWGLRRSELVSSSNISLCGHQGGRRIEAARHQLDTGCALVHRGLQPMFAWCMHPVSCGLPEVLQ